jgi:hypothetical protein
MDYVFESPQEFIKQLNHSGESGFFVSKEGQKLLDILVYQIETAIIDGKKTAPLFNLSFEQSSRSFSILSTKSNWKKILKTCQAYFEKAGEIDKSIDTYMVIKKLNKK